MLSFLIPGRRRFHGGGHGNPLQYSCLEKPHGQRSLATVHTVSKSQTWLKRHHSTAMLSLGFPGWLSNKESTCRTGEVRDSVSNSGSGRSPGGGHSNALNILTWRIPCCIHYVSIPCISNMTSWYLSLKVKQMYIICLYKVFLSYNFYKWLKIFAYILDYFSIETGMIFFNIICAGEHPQKFKFWILSNKR